MEKITEDKIKQAIGDLQLAMIENLEASRAETTSKLRKIKAHNDLLIAQRAISDLAINNYEV